MGVSPRCVAARPPRSNQSSQQTAALRPQQQSTASHVRLGELFSVLDERKPRVSGGFLHLFAQPVWPRFGTCYQHSLARLCKRFHFKCLSRNRLELSGACCHGHVIFEQAAAEVGGETRPKNKQRTAFTSCRCAKYLAASGRTGEAYSIGTWAIIRISFCHMNPFDSINA